MSDSERTGSEPNNALKLAGRIMQISTIKVFKTADETVIGTVYAYDKDHRGIVGRTPDVSPKDFAEALQKVIDEMQRTDQSYNPGAYNAKNLTLVGTTGRIKAQGKENE